MTAVTLDLGGRMPNRFSRLGHNESNFRDENEKLEAISRADGETLIDFVCECGNDLCHATMRLTHEEYEKVRGGSGRFALADRGHLIADVENVVEEFDRYVVIEKHGDSKVAADSRDPRAHVKTCRVLVVDDVVEVRLLLKMLLQLEPSCTVVAEAGNGQEAIDIAGVVKPDVVVLDLEMPLMNGIEALPQIIEQAPGVRIIAFSAAPDIDERELVRLGAFDFVAKGGDPSIIVHAIKEAALSGARQSKRLTAE